MYCEFQLILAEAALQSKAEASLTLHAISTHVSPIHYIFLHSYTPFTHLYFVEVLHMSCKYFFLPYSYAFFSSSCLFSISLLFKPKLLIISSIPLFSLYSTLTIIQIFLCIAALTSQQLRQSIFYQKYTTTTSQLLNVEQSHFLLQ